MKNLVVVLTLTLSLFACTEGDKTSIDRSPLKGIVGGKVVNADESWARKALAIYITTIMADEPTKICTGSAIDTNIIITAAHCVVADNQFADIRVILPNGQEEILTAVQVIPHPDFDMETSRNPDLAILILDRALPGSVEILKLPSTGQDLQLKIIATAGYGNTSGIAKDQSRSGTLHSVDLDVTSYSPSNRFIEADQSNGKGVCMGDSGGPAIAEHKGETYLVGITKGGSPSKQDTLPLEEQDRCNGRAYFTNLQVPLHLDWILTVLSQTKDTGSSIKN